MIVCPNLSNPEVAREFEELKNATSEKAAYHIWSANNGNSIDKAPSGAKSILFEQLLEHTNGDRLAAIRLKSEMYKPDYLIENNQEEPTITQLLDDIKGLPKEDASSDMIEYPKQMEKYADDKMSQSNGEKTVVNKIQYQKEWVQQKQKEVMQDTQVKLSQAYGLSKNEDGTWSGNDLLVQFVDYIDGADGYYDHNTRSTYAHHVITLALNTADTSTFNHELAHHYIRMFWKSSLIQNALGAVDKPGMSDREREEALVDIITAKTSSSKFMSAVEKNSFFHKFWDKFGSMLYKAFHIKNNTTKNALLNNAARAFLLNEQQQLNDDMQVLYNFVNDRVFKSKSNEYAKRRAISNKQQVNDNVDVKYSALQQDKTQEAISKIISGTVAKVREYKKSPFTDSAILVRAQLQDAEVRQFAKEIEEFREEARKQLNKKSLSPTEKYSLTQTPKEITANLKLIQSFINDAQSELRKLASMLLNAQSTGFNSILYREVIDPVTGLTQTQYVDASHAGQPGVYERKLSFDELQHIQTNIIGFYNNILPQLISAVKSEEFKQAYGRDVAAQLESDLTGIQVKSGIVNNTGLNQIVQYIENIYNTAIFNKVVQLCDKYVDDNVQLNDELKNSLKYTIRTWLRDQSNFGDLGIHEILIGLASHSKSPILRILQDIIDNIEHEKHHRVIQKGDAIKALRDKAYKKATLLGIPLTGFEKLFMEKDDYGFTGNFVSSINVGKFHTAKERFINELLFGKNGIENTIRTKENDNDFELEIGVDGLPSFPEKYEKYENEFLLKLNKWYGENAVRRFTTAYYEKRIQTLSKLTRDALRKYDSQINAIIRSCTINGEVHTDLLPVQKQKHLANLYEQKSQLGNFYDNYGNLKQKGTDEYIIAEELQRWNDFTKDVIKYKTDEEAFNLAYQNSKDKAQFLRDNTHLIISEQYIDAVNDALGREKTNDPYLQDLYQKRAKLISLIKKRGLNFADIRTIWDDENGKIKDGWENFFVNLKQLDQQIYNYVSKNNNNGNKNSGVNYSDFFTRAKNPYTGVRGNGEATWIKHITKQVATSNMPVDQKNQILDLLFYNTDKGKSPLSIFSLTAPTADKVSVNNKLIETSERVPIQAYSKIDSKKSNSQYVDTSFDETSEYAQQPLKSIYQNKQYDKLQSMPKEVLDYFNALQDTMRESYESVVQNGKYDNRLPQIGAGLTQMLYRINPISALFRSFKRTYLTLTESDDDIAIDYSVRPDGKRSMHIPIRYVQRLEKPSEINSDIFGTVMQFYQMAQNFQLKVEKIPILQSVLGVLDQNNTNRGRQRKAIRGMINRQFYGKLTSYDFDAEQPGVVSSKWGRLGLKFLPAIKGLTQTGLLALGWIPGLVSYLDPLLSMVVEAINNKYYDMSDFIVGNLQVLLNLPTAIRGAGSTRGYGKIAAGMRHFGMHKRGAESYKYSNRTQLGRLLSDNFFMWAFSIGEYTIGAQTFATMMHSYRYYNGKFYTKAQFIEHMTSSGTMTAKQAARHFNTKMQSNTLYGAYTVGKGGKFEIKPKYKSAITPEFERQVAKAMENRQNNTILKVSSAEKTQLQSNVLMSFLLVMRTFMLPAIADKFKQLHDFQIEDDTVVSNSKQAQMAKLLQKEYSNRKGGYNFQTGQIEYGTTRAALNMLFGHPMRTLKYLMYRLHHPTINSKDEQVKQMRDRLGISETDIYGLNKFLTELAVIGVISIISTIWHNRMIDDDDDDSYTDVLIDLLLLRLTLERITFINPGTIGDIVTSITPSTADFDRKMHFIDLISDTYAGLRDHASLEDRSLHIDEWEKIKRGAYKGKPRVFKDLLLTLSSIGAHNAYTTSSTAGLQEKMKWYRKLWAPQNPFLKKKSDKQTISNPDEFVYDSEFDNSNPEFATDDDMFKNEK